MSDTKISNKAVLKATGKNWKEWFEILDREGSIAKQHKEIATWLGNNFEISGWWAQMITVQYERERGMRKVHEKADGFSASKSKTYHFPVHELFKAWINPEERKEWLENPNFEIRTFDKNKTIRITWPDQTHVDVSFAIKGKRKTQVSIQHNKLPEQSDVKKQKSYWQNQINRLSDFLKNQGEN